MSKKKKEGPKMSKRKKITIGIITVLVIIIAAKSIFGGKPEPEAQEVPQFEYFTVEDIDQVYINGIVTPTESREFIKDATLGKLGDLNVKNGDNVEEGTVLYQYVDETTDSQITDLKFQIETSQAEKEKAARQMQLELNELENQDNQAANQATESTGEVVTATPQNTEETRESIRLKYDLNGYDIKMNQFQSQIDELNAKQINQVTAPFNGQVTVPQEQNRDSAVMTLTSNDFYVEGEINERDLAKIKVQQIADVKTIADNQIYKGEITYISNSPTTSKSLSTYTVKLTLKDAAAIREGFHVQASIKLDDKKITVPEDAIHIDEKENKKYVFVDDFGTILRKDIEVADTGAEKGMVIVESGLEGLDKIIVKSEKELVSGELIEEDSTENLEGSN